MVNADYLKHLVIHTPLEPLAYRVQGMMPTRDAVPRMLREETRAMHQVMRRLIAPDFWCADIGAHLGSMLSRMLNLAPGGRHFAFEAVPRKAAWLRAKFPQVTVHETALSEHRGEMSFYVDRRSSGCSSLTPGDGRQQEKIVVSASPLDDLMDAVDRLDFVKIDVEGAELDVLRGGRRTLERRRPFLLLECTIFGNVRHKRSPADVHAFLTDKLGYDIYTPADYLAGRSPITRDAFDVASVYPPTAYNFVAAPTERPGV